MRIRLLLSLALIIFGHLSPIFGLTHVLASSAWDRPTGLLRPHLPANAMPEAHGKAWRCKYGFEETGGRCQKIIVPAHAALNSRGDDWQCRPAYQRVGNRCEANHRSFGSRVNISAGTWQCRSGYKLVDGVCKLVMLPKNAEFNDASPAGWKCRSGFHRAGIGCKPSHLPRDARWVDRERGLWKCNEGFFRSGRRCVNYPLPKYASPSDTEPLGYECRSSYRNSGGQCVKIKIPRNAKLTANGHDWECRSGFERRGRRCVPIVYRTTYLKNEYFTDTMLCGEKKARTITGVCGGRYVVGSVQLCSKNQFFKGEVFYPADNYSSRIRGKQLKSGAFNASDTLGNYCELGLN
jgi:hypothetical protein